MSGECDPEGLKIFAGRTPLEINTKPIFEGQQTLAMVREIYGIPDPDKRQMILL